MSEREYVLGTHDEELERLGLQHRVWRPYVLDAWDRAGLTGQDRAAAILRAFEAAARQPGTRMCTPGVVEIIARTPNRLTATGV